MPSCQEIRDALAQCLAESDCVMAGNKASDCLRPPLADTLSPECKTLKYSYGACKRNLIDMRKRFRGPMPVNYTRAHAEGGGGQLYSGIGEKKSLEKPKAGGEEEDGELERR